MLERGNEAVVVALVQSDGRLIEHIHHAREATADLRSQANALRFAARKRFGAALQAQIAQAHVVEKFQAAADFPHHLVRNVRARALQAQRGKPRLRVGQRGAADFVNGAGVRPLAHRHAARLGAQARAAAFGARLAAAQAGQLLAHHGRVGLAPAAGHVWNHAFKRVLFACRALRLLPGSEGVAEVDGFLARAVQHHLLHARRQRLKRRVHTEAVMPRQALQHGEVKGVAPVPALDGAAGQAQRRKGHHALRVKKIRAAQPVARRAGARGRVEGKQARLQLRQRPVAARAGKAGVEQMLAAAVHLQRNGAAIGQAQRGLETLGQALALLGQRFVITRAAHLDAVDHHVDVVLFGLFQRGHVRRLQHLAAHAKAHVARRLHLRQQIGELAFFAARHGRQHHQLRAFGQGQHGIHHLADGLRLQGRAVLRAVRHARAGVEQAQVVVNFRHRAHGGARVVAGGLLLDGNGRRQALDQVHIRLVHALQKLPRVGRKAFHIAPLPFGVERVKGQAGLARAAQPRDDHELIARNVQIDVFQVVRARAAHVHGPLAQGGSQRQAVTGGGRSRRFRSHRRQKSNRPLSGARAAAPLAQQQAASRGKRALSHQKQEQIKGA